MTNKQPGQDSYYLVINNIQRAKEELAKIANVAQAIKDVITHQVKRSQYVWWSDGILKTASGALVLEVPRNFIKVQRWLQNHYPNIIYDNVSIRPLLPTGDIL